MKGVFLILVLDLFSGRIKFGFSGETEPALITPGIISIPRYVVMTGCQHSDIYFGEDALTHRGMLALLRMGLCQIGMTWRKCFVIDPNIQSLLRNPL